MDEAGQKLIQILLRLSKIDTSIARIAAEKREIQTAIAADQALLKKTHTDFTAKSKAFQEEQSRCNKEEKSLKEEREKLVQRRKALASLNNYKLQQAAEREIEHASRQLGIREEALLKVLDQVETAGKEVDALKNAAQEVKSRIEKALSDSKEAFARFEEREAKYAAEREEIVPRIEQRVYYEYDRIRQRFPTDPLAAIAGSSCAACYMQVAPQTVVLIGLGKSIEKCRGCGRILYLTEEPGQSPPKQAG